MERTTRWWLKLSLLSLTLVAGLGLLMRYKIGFSFPFLEQKSIQFAHSYFAFYGWISQTLMVFMVAIVRKYGHPSWRYNKLFLANFLSSLGLLISFMFFGYGLASSVFSAILIIISYIFAVCFLKDMRRAEVPRTVANWFLAAIFFNILSTLGSIVLAWMMLTKNLHQNAYLALVYYFLHFQYNGWFFFACMGLLADFTRSYDRVNRKAFRLFTMACIPAYLLSVLWFNLPVWLDIVIGIAALMQIVGWFVQYRNLMQVKPVEITSQPPILKYILAFVGIALSIKLLLQLGSTVPAISKLAFGFRPIVIAYLHLVLLAVISLFLLFYMYANGFFRVNQRIKIGLWLFSTGVFLNELVLGIQGIAGFSYTIVPYVNEILFGIAMLLFLSAAVLFASSDIRNKKSPDYDFAHKSAE